MCGIGTAAGSEPTRLARVGLAKVHQLIEILVCPVVGVHVDPHDTPIRPERGFSSFASATR
jgi:hypothetical protein